MTVGIKVAKTLAVFAAALVVVPAIPFLLVFRWALYLRGPNGMFGFGCAALLRAWDAEPRAVHYYSGIGPEFVVIMVKRQPEGAEVSTRDWTIRALEAVERKDKGAALGSCWVP